MTGKKIPLVFVDSSVFFTAVLSPTGGSAKVFSLADKEFQLLVSPLVLTEVERNVRKKLTKENLQRFFMLVEKCKLVKQKINQHLLAMAEEVIVKKDALILAEAKKAEVEFLLTLDRKHFLKKRVRDFFHPSQIVTPKQLLQGN